MGWFFKNWDAKHEEKVREQLKQDAMEKLRAADYASKNDKETLYEACRAVLKALNRGVVFDTEQPIFQRFHQQTWRRAMERLCKTEIDPRTEIEQNIAQGAVSVASTTAGNAIGTAIGGAIGNAPGAAIGFFVGGLIGWVLRKPVNRFCEKPIMDSQDKWDEFYDSIPNNKNRALAKDRNRDNDRESLKECLDKCSEEGNEIVAPKHEKKYPAWWWKMKRNFEERRFNSGRKAA